MKLSRLCFSTLAVLAISGAVHAQHSYLPVTKTGGDTTIEAFHDGDPVRVMIHLFGGDDNIPVTGTNIFRSFGPNAFTVASGDASIPAGYETLAGEEDLILTMPTLAHPDFDASGSLLKWDDTAGTFGAVGTNTKITMSRYNHDVIEYAYETVDMPPVPVVLDNASGDFTFVVDTTLASGARNGHYHMIYDIVGSPGGVDEEAPDGTYLLGHTVGMDGFLESGLVHVLLHKNFSGSGAITTGFINAVSYVNSNLVPEPTAGLILAAGAGLALVRRSRKAVS